MAFGQSRKIKALQNMVVTTCPYSCVLSWMTFRFADYEIHQINSLRFNVFLLLCSSSTAAQPSLIDTTYIYVSRWLVHKRMLCERRFEVSRDNLTIFLNCQNFCHLFCVQIFNSFHFIWCFIWSFFFKQTLRVHNFICSLGTTKMRVFWHPFWKFRSLWDSYRSVF